MLASYLPFFIMRPPPRKRQRTAKALNSVSEISSNSADSLSNSLLQRNTSEQPIVVPHIPVIDYQLLAQEILKQQGNVNNTRTAPSSETVTVPLSKSYTTAHTSTDMNPAINNSSLSSAPSSQIREHNATISLNSDEFQLSQPMMITTTDSIANRQHGQNVVHSIIDNIFNASDVTATTIDQESQKSGTMAESSRNTNSNQSNIHLTPQTLHILRSSLSYSACKTYHHAWKLFFEFNPTVSSLPLSVVDVCNFIGHLFGKSLSPNTITSHVSALSYVHKLFGLFDPTTQFIIKKLLKGCENLKGSADTRLPITYELLFKLVTNLDNCIQNFYHKILLKAVFLLSFHAFLRLGEILIRVKSDTDRVLQKHDVKINKSNGILQSATITLRSYKNMKHNKPVTISLSANLDNQMVCPAKALELYLAHFSHSDGPLFQFQNGKPVTHQFVTKNLSLLLEFLGLNSKLYKGHSFRIGAATHAASLGIPETKIRQFGRWNSNAVNHYIRISNFHT